jgi:hypothetical protein
MNRPLPFTPGPIGVFDSGFGGLTVLREIRALLPEYDYLFLGDNARAPYGTRSFDVVYHYTLQGVMALFRQQAGKEARPGADVQHAQRSPLRQVFVKFREPAVLLLALKFPQTLGLKALRPVGPVMRHPMLDSFHDFASL